MNYHYTKLAMNSQSSCLTHLSGRQDGVCHHRQQESKLCKFQDFTVQCTGCLPLLLNCLTAYLMQCSICLTQSWASYKMLPEDLYSVKHTANEIQVCTCSNYCVLAIIKKDGCLFSFFFFSKHLLQESNYHFLKASVLGLYF